MDINWLEDFVCLARTLNFTRAADERHITQSAFSRRIKSLESWVGTPLIDRSAYPATLSKAGEVFLPVAKTVLLQLLNTRSELRAEQALDAQFYTIAAPHTLSITHLAPILSELEKLGSDIRTQVRSENLHNCCQLLTDGACDFLLCHRHPDIPLTLDQDRFERIDIGTETIKPFSKSHSDGRARWHLANNHETIPYLGYSSGTFLQTVVAHILKKQCANLDLRHADSFAESIKSLALQGMGIAWLPESAAQEAVEAGELSVAGGDEWSAVLTLSIFAAPEVLDETGRKIWAYFQQGGQQGGLVR